MTEAERVARIICMSMGDDPDWVVSSGPPMRTKTGSWVLPKYRFPAWGQYANAAEEIISDRKNSVSQRLYDSEINFSISCFWDDGFEVKLGDEMNGFQAETNVRTFEEAERWFEETAKTLYPDSQFARES